MFRPVIFVAACALLVSISAQARNCGELPRFDVKTPADLCGGVLASGLKMPRGILPLDDGRLLVVKK